MVTAVVVGGGGIAGYAAGRHEVLSLDVHPMPANQPLNLFSILGGIKTACCVQNPAIGCQSQDRIGHDLPLSLGQLLQRLQGESVSSFRPASQDRGIAAGDIEYQQIDFIDEIVKLPEWSDLNVLVPGCRSSEIFLQCSIVVHGDDAAVGVVSGEQAGLGATASTEIEDAAGFHSDRGSNRLCRCRILNHG